GAIPMQRITRAIIPLLAILGAISLAQAGEVKISEVGSLADVKVSDLKPGVIVFTDHRKDELVDPATGLIKFEDWTRAQPLQKELLSLYPGYVEPTVNTTVDGVTKSIIQKLSMYVVEARYLLPKSATAVDLTKYVALPFLGEIDTAIKHQ